MKNKLLFWSYIVLAGCAVQAGKDDGKSSVEKPPRTPAAAPEKHQVGTLSSTLKLKGSALPSSVDCGKS